MHESWMPLFDAESAKPYFVKVFLRVNKLRDEGAIIYPAKENVFRAFEVTGLSDVKVVILGQDPYIRAGQACGLSFSVPDGTPAPPSLVNIFKELNSDLGVPISKSGCLDAWAERGVLLLNSVLTVTAGASGSHAAYGWQQLTNAAIREVSDKTTNSVFILWGNYAQEKESLINAGKHLVLKARHPSPMSAHTGFFGCKHFSKANAYLKSHGRDEIDWNLGL